uniref:ShKT domain-containing protein n=1 Tax=Parascaris univalens TaxID=6257 RepID=A0A915CC31_PARUN
MHYDSVAFSKNGRNTMEAVDEHFTPIIGTALELSVADVKKINKLYKCHARKKKITRPLIAPPSTPSSSETPQLCEDYFADCPHFEEYCTRASFAHIMRSYCPYTCNQCAQHE